MAVWASTNDFGGGVVVPVAVEVSEQAPMTCGTRVIDRSLIADVTPEAAWAKIAGAVGERDMDEVKEAVAEYVKSLHGNTSYREIQEGLIGAGVNLWFIATEKPTTGVFTNMDLRGNCDKKYAVSYRFSEHPERAREIEGWPKNREEILQRLDDAGDTVSSGFSRCHNCSEIGHRAKECPQEKRESEKPKIVCSNCESDGHRVRDCPDPRPDPNKCRNCGQPGHRSNDCDEPPNLDNVECRRCSEMGHFAKDCPTSGGFACRHCGQEGHKAAECDQPRNMDNVVCRNCERNGHMSRDCPEPKDWSKVQCSNCQEFGHTKVRCKQVPAELAPEPGAYEDAAPADDGGW